MNFSKFFARAFTLAFLLGVCLSGQVSAQVTTNGGSGLAATYPSLAAAITALNGATISSPVIITLTGAETAIPGGYIITAEGSSANPIVIQGVNSTISASTAHTVGSLHDAIFELRGADYITIENFTLQENAANTTFGTAATNNMTEWAIALLYVSATNGAQNNTLQNNIISLNRSYRNTFGVYSNVRHNATAMTTTADITAPTGANSGNKVYGNAISNVNYGIVFVGANVAANMDTGNDVGGNALTTGNVLTNWGGAASLSSYVSLTGNNAGIFMNHQLNDNICFNSITSANISGTTVAFVGIQKAYSAAPPSGNLNIMVSFNTITLASANTAGNMTGIISSGVSNLATAAAIINNNQIVNCSITGASTTSAFTGITNTSSLGDLTISNNVIKGLSTSSVSGNFAGISNAGAIINTNTISNNQIGDASAGAVTYTVANSGVFNGIINASAGATGTATISSNDIRGINYTAAASHAVNLINNSGSAISLTILSNTFTNLAINTTGTVTFISHSYGMQTGAAQRIEQNRLVGGFSKLGAGAQVVGIGATGASSATSTSEYLNNDFSNITVTGATNIFGISNNDGTGTGSPNRNITGNIFANWTAGTGALVGIGLSHIGATSSLNQNIIRNLNTAGNVSGVTVLSVAANGNPFTLSANTITGLISTNGTAEGINSASASPMVNITDNRIYNLVANGVSANGLLVSAGASVTIKRSKIGDIQNNASNGVVNGILLTGGTQSSLSNNIIGDLRAPAANLSTPAVVGVNISGITVDTARLYFNTIFLNASSTGTDFSTAGVFVNTTTKTALNNNIIVNSSVAAGAGASVAYRRTDATLSTYLATSNRNDFFAPVIYADGTNSDATLAAYKTRVASRDANSINENPNFLSTTVSAANYLHINTTIATGLESGGADAGVAVDYDGDIRQGNAGYTGTGTAPDMGADEFELVNTNCASASAGTITNPSAAYCVGGTHMLSASVPAILPGISYQWKVSTTSGIGYTDIPNATTTTYSTTGLAAGVYYYVLSTSCSFAATSALSNEAVLTVHAKNVTVTSANTTCSSCTDGSVSSMVMGGLAPYTYMWSNTRTSQNITGLGAGRYDVTVTDANGCTATAGANVATTLGVAQTLSEQVRVFPNPSQSLVFVDGLPTNEAVRISLQNALGQTLWMVEINQQANFQADLSSLPTGAYFLSIQTNTNQFSKQVLKID